MDIATDGTEAQDRTTTRLTWFTSSYSSGNGQCVECARVPGGMAVRDTKEPTGTMLTFGEGAWEEFLAEVRCLNTGLTTELLSA